MSKSTILASVLSPLSILPVVLLAIALDLPSAYSFPFILNMVFMISFYGVPIAYAGVGLFGLPMHLILVRHGLTKRRFYVLLGAIAPIVFLAEMAVILQLLTLPMGATESVLDFLQLIFSQLTSPTILNFAWMMAVCGGVVGGVFHVVARPGRCLERHASEELHILGAN